jgi:hypothetical protein
MDKASQHFHLKPMCDHKQMPSSAGRIAGEKLQSPALLCATIIGVSFYDRCACM